MIVACEGWRDVGSYSVGCIILVCMNVIQKDWNKLDWSGIGCSMQEWKLLV